MEPRDYPPLSGADYDREHAKGTERRSEPTTEEELLHLLLAQKKLFGGLLVFSLGYLITEIPELKYFYYHQRLEFVTDIAALPVMIIIVAAVAPFRNRGS